MASLTPRIDKLDKNYIINGNFDYWQRGTSFGSNVSNAASINTVYVADRFKVRGKDDIGGGAVTVLAQKYTDSDLKNWLKYELGSMPVSESGYTVQRIEDVTKLANKNITISFKMFSSVAANNCFIFLTQDFGSGGSSPVIVSNVNFNCTTNAQQFTFNVTVPSVSGKTIGASNYLELRIHTPVGLNGIFYFTDILVYEGDHSEPEFTIAGRDTYEELSLCQRYYEKSYDINVNPGTITDNGRLQLATLSGANKSTFEYKATKRINPTVTFYNNATGTSGQIRISGGGGSAVPVVSSYTKHYTLGFSGALANQDAEWHFTSDAEL